MKTLKELNKPFQMENELSETRLKLIALDRRLRHLNRTQPKNPIESLGIWLQKVGIKMQIKSVLFRMKSQNPNIIK
jgi:hypothetical protein